MTYDGSSCGDNSSGPLLAIEFGEGHYWSISFVKTDDSYEGNITFIYNTNDEELFPDAKRKGKHDSKWFCCNNFCSSDSSHNSSWAEIKSQTSIIAER